MKLPDSHNFRGVQYRILWRHPRGYPRSVGGCCSSPRKTNPTIEISPRLSDKNKLRVILDESIHACIWDYDNEIVDEISTQVAHLLWECGLRFEEK